MNRRVLAVATFCFALVIGLLVIVSSRRPRVEPVAAPSVPSTPRTTAPEAPSAPRAETPRPASRAPEAVAPARPEPPARPEEAEAVAELGTLRIETDVPGAQVFIDRQFIGTAPLTAENVKPGPHRVNVTAEGFDGTAQTIDVEPGPR